MTQLVGIKGTNSDLSLIVIKGYQSRKIPRGPICVRLKQKLESYGIMVS